MWYEMVEYLLKQLMSLFNVDLTYFAQRMPVVKDIDGNQMHIFINPTDYSIKVAEPPTKGICLLDDAPKNAAARSYRAVAEEALHTMGDHYIVQDIDDYIRRQKT